MGMQPKYLRPPWFVSGLINPLAMRFGLGGAVTLAAKGRKNGEWRTMPIKVIEHNGQRYLVVPRGDTQWARNLHASEADLRSRPGQEPSRIIGRSYADLKHATRDSLRSYNMKGFRF